jgi:SAM-dependent methyltransferase
MIEERLAELSSEPVEILDVGAGPASSLGSVAPARTLSIVAVDPLAAEYAAMLARLGVRVAAPSIPGYAETLGAMFAPHSFDVVYARNSLDHARDPLRALREMLRLVRPSGFVALRHVRCEGENAGYADFHQWNFDIRGDGPELWNRRRRHPLASALPAAVEAAGFEGRCVTVVLRPAPAHTG